jgi:hypothetical protein
MALSKPEVVEQVHAFLKRRAVTRLYPDSHDSLRGRPVLEPYQRFTVDLGEFVVHPDLVALEADGETLVAIKAKGSGYRAAFAGLTQAELYQVAFHRTYLAADARFGKRAESDALPELCPESGLCPAHDRPDTMALPADVERQRRWTLKVIAIFG